MFIIRLNGNVVNIVLGMSIAGVCKATDHALYQEENRTRTASALTCDCILSLLHYGRRYDCSRPTLSGSFTEFDYIRDHLGYRLSLESASFPVSVVRTPDSDSDLQFKGVSESQSDTKGGMQLEFRATLVNWGFAAPLNPRPVRLALIDAKRRIVLNYTLPSANVLWTPIFCVPRPASGSTS